MSSIAVQSTDETITLATFNKKRSADEADCSAEQFPFPCKCDGRRRDCSYCLAGDDFDEEQNLFSCFSTKGDLADDIDNLPTDFGDLLNLAKARVASGKYDDMWMIFDEMETILAEPIEEHGSKMDYKWEKRIASSMRSVQGKHNITLPEKWKCSNCPHPLAMPCGGNRGDLNESYCDHCQRNPYFNSGGGDDPCVHWY